MVKFGARVIDQGAQANQESMDWFDNVTIHDSSVQSAYFLTSGNDTTPDGLFYDSELVFGGDANGEATSFTSMNSTLGLFYTNGTTSSALTAFPSYFSFGGDTQEAADNLHTTYSGNGIVHLSVGTPNYDYLGTATGSFSLPSIETTLGIPGSTTTSTTFLLHEHHLDHIDRDLPHDDLDFYHNQQRIDSIDHFDDSEFYEFVFFFHHLHSQFNLGNINF